MTAGRYFTGKPCKRGHLSERYLSTRGCVECLAGNVQKRPVQPHIAVTLRVHSESELARVQAFYAALVRS